MPAQKLSEVLKLPPPLLLEVEKSLELELELELLEPELDQLNDEELLDEELRGTRRRPLCSTVSSACRLRSRVM
ncbi:hypothetical protein D3C76_1716020 [compost metagenome]